MNLSLGILLLAVNFGVGNRFHLEHNRDGFGMRSHGVIESLDGGKTKFYRLPQSTAAQFRKLRSQDVRNNPIRAEQYNREEVIGPYQIEGDKIWFGNQYYDSEGSSGVGAFGYFDTATRTYTLYSPPEVARWEVRAILVTPEAVWLGLDSAGEYGNGPGGLVQWDRTSRRAHRYEIEFIVTSIREEDGALRLGTLGGYAFLKDGQISRFRSNGKPIKRFPPPPGKDSP